MTRACRRQRIVLGSPVRAGRSPAQREPGPGLSSDGALDALARALDAPDATRRVAALEVICEFVLDHSVTLLGPMFYDPDVEVRLAATRAAARLGLPDLLPPLIVALEDPAVEVRRAAAGALEEITGHEVLPGPERDDDFATSARELKHWWKERRLRELSEGSGAAHESALWGGARAHEPRPDRTTSTPGGTPPAR